MEENLVRGIKIGVNCIKDNLEGISSNGIEYLGFNFIVKEKDKEEMMQFVIEALDHFELPIDDINLYEEDDYPISKIWSKEKIECEMRRCQYPIKWECEYGRKY